MWLACAAAPCVVPATVDVVLSPQSIVHCEMVSAPGSDDDRLSVTAWPARMLLGATTVIVGAMFATLTVKLRWDDDAPWASTARTLNSTAAAPSTAVQVTRPLALTVAPAGPESSR